jgi:hypothetical protein
MCTERIALPTRLACLPMEVQECFNRPQPLPLHRSIFLVRGLEMPAPSRMTWRWNVGVNYVGSAGDKRWWQDHRIPGGVGFSTNSVGHLAKAGMIAEKTNELQQLVPESSDELVATKINSMPTALEWAMRTIHNASESPSGKATELSPLSSSSTSMECPIKLPTFLQDRNHCTYRGWYHTDVTVPSEYSRADAERPAGAMSHELHFTYLFDTDLSNPDYVTTATGEEFVALKTTTSLLLKSRVVQFQPL